MNGLTLSGPTLFPDGQIAPATVRLHGGQIESVRPGLSPTADILADGCIAPGLIDLQLNGGYGFDFTTDPGSVAAVAARLPETGVTAFMPTVITSPWSTYRERIATIAETRSSRGAQIAGIHLEGPFINQARKGAHDGTFARPIVVDELLLWAEHPLVRIITLAPELPNAPEAIRGLRAAGKVVSAGHSNATFAQATAGFAAGINWGTHLFNAMPELRQREPGLAGALLHAPFPVGLIADGVHVHAEMLEMAVRLKGAGGITLVTDAMAAMGMPAGEYRLANQIVHVDATSARLADGTLAGSVLTLDQALRSIIDLTNCSLSQALTMATRTPALEAGLHNKGQLALGCDADITIFDQSLHVAQTIIAGNVVFEAADQFDGGR